MNISRLTTSSLLTLVYQDETAAEYEVTVPGTLSYWDNDVKTISHYSDNTVIVTTGGAGEYAFSADDIPDEIIV